VTGRRRGPKRKLWAGYPTERRHYIYIARHVVMRFHRRVWYRALSLRYVHIRSSDIVLIT